MNQGSKKCPFADKLLLLLPHAKIENISHKNWFSATFSGQQISVKLSVPANGSCDDINRFTDILPDHDFGLNGHFVAEISAPEIVELNGKTLISIYALLITE